MELHLHADDVEDDKGKSALERYAIEEVSLSHARFQEAYALLDAEFGVRGELERREVIEAWLSFTANSFITKQCGAK